MGYLRTYLAGPAGSRLLAAAVFGLSLSGPLSAAALAQEAEDPSDLAYVQGQLNKILEFERTAAVIPWSNPKTGNSGTVRIDRTYFFDPKTPCRDYVRTVEKDGEELLSIRGTGCREGLGKWNLTEDSKPKRTVRREPKEKAPKAAATAKDAAGSAGKPTELKPDPKAADAEAETKAAKAEAAKKKAAAAKPPPPPEIPVRLPRRTVEWEAGGGDG